MEFEIFIYNKKRWLKDISSIDRKSLLKIFEKIDELKKNPWPEGLAVKRLKNYKHADYRLRVGSYRVLLNRDLERGVVVLFRILHRSCLY